MLKRKQKGNENASIVGNPAIVNVISIQILFLLDLAQD